MIAAPVREAIDLTGQTITTYIISSVDEALAEMRGRETLSFISDDFIAIENDIQAWCRITGAPPAEVVREDNQLRFSIRKTPRKKPDRTVAMAISNPGPEELLSPLGARFYLCGGSMDHFGVEEGDIAYDNVIIAEYFTFMEVMVQSEIQMSLG